MSTGSIVEAIVDGIAALAKFIAGLMDADREQAIEYARQKHGDAFAARLRMMVEAELAIAKAQAAIDAASSPE